MPFNEFPLFDSHFHIIDRRFPLVPNQGYLPDDFSCSEYLSRMQKYRLMGGAIVSGSFQAFDCDYLLDALAQLGPSFVGVAQLPATVADDMLHKLDQAGVRGIRFNLKRGGSEDISQLDYLARRVHDLVGWHVELYVDSRELDGLFTTLVKLPSVSIDHLGLSRDGMPVLLKLVEKGVRVKACGFSRVDFDVAGALKDIHAADAGALMFGTDLPSTRAPRPYDDNDFKLVVDTLGPVSAARVFRENALDFYRPKERFPAFAAAEGK